MADDCETRILSDDVKKALFGDQDIPKKLLRQFIQDAQNIKKLAAENPQLGTYQSQMNKYVAKVRELNKIEKAVKAMNIARNRENFAHVTQPAFKNDPVTGVKSLLAKVNELGNNVSNNAEARAYAIKGSWQNTAYAMFEKGALTKRFVSGELDAQIRKAVWAMKDGTSLKGITPEVQEMAKALTETNRLMLADQQGSGIPVREMEHYTVPQTHSPELAAAAGQEKWVNFVRSLNFDKEFMFGRRAGDDKAEQSILESIYKQVTAGRIGPDARLGGEGIEDVLKGSGYERSASNRLSQSRFIKFLDPESEQKYADAFGGRTMSEALTSTINSKSRLLALVQKFGSNPDASIRANVDRLHDYYNRIGRGDLADQLKPNPGAPGDAAYNKGIVNLYNEVSGYNGMPANDLTAKIGAGIRTMQMLSKFGEVGFAHTTNFAQTAIQIKDATGANFLSSVGSTVKEFAHALPSSNREATMKLAGMVLDSMQDHVTAAASDGPAGIGQKGVGLLTKMTGMQYFIDGAKTGFARNFMSSALEQLEKGEITPELKTSFLKSGIAEKEYSILKRGFETAGDGNRYLTPEGIRNIPIDLEVKAAASQAKLKPEAYLRDLDLRYATAVHSGAMTSSVTTGAAEGALLNMGTQRGTALGEVTRLAMQFKQFGMRGFNTVMQVLNAKADEQLLARGTLMSKGMDAPTFAGRASQKNWSSMAQLSVMATAIGYVRQAVKDMVNGKNVANPEHLKTWTEAVAASGMGGIFGEEIFRESQKYGMGGFLGSLAGPTFGQALPVAAGIVQTGVQGKSIPREMKKEAVRVVRSNIPFQNAPLARHAFDYLQYDVINESMFPGSASRRRSKQAEYDREDRTNFPYGG